MRRPLLSVAAVAVAAAGCGGGSDETLPPACLAGEGDVVRALAAAPGPVSLEDGTPLSACVADVRSDAELQELGVILSAAADRLDGDDLRLGYLVGAVRRGAATTNGVALELARRLESNARRAGDRRALARGIAAGEANG